MVGRGAFRAPAKLLADVDVDGGGSDGAGFDLRGSPFRRISCGGEG